MSVELTVVENVTELSVTETPVVLSLQNVGVQGATGATGATGAKGDKGDLGTFTDKGEWSSATTYSAYDMVTHLGCTYYAKQANTNQTPRQDTTTFWQMMAEGFNGITAWVSGSFYYIGDVVTDAGSTFYCYSRVSTSGDRTTDPGALSTKWLKIASKGDTGAAGAAGQIGLYYQLTADLAYASAPTVSTDWSPFSTTNTTLGVLTDSSSAYVFEGEFKILGSTQTTSHNLMFSVGASQTLLDCDGTISVSRQTTAFTAIPTAATQYTRHIAAGSTAYSIEAATTAVNNRYVRVKGILRTPIASTYVYPQFRYTGASEIPTILAGSYFMITKIPSITSNGTWV